MALEGAYAFDDVGELIVFDFSGNERHIDLTGTNGVQVVGGQTGGALGKIGPNTVSLPASLLAATESDDRSLMFDALGGRSVWLVRWESVTLNTGVFGALSLDATNVMTRARDQSNNGTTPGGPTIGALSETVWHNFCLVYVRGNGVLSYYYDGALAGTATFPAGTQLYVGADDLNIAEWSTTGPSLDNLRFFSHALNATEVANLAGTPVTSSAIVVEGTAASDLAGLSGTVSGTRVTTAVMIAGLSGLVGTATGTRIGSGSASAVLGGLSGTANGTATTFGNATAALTTLVATATAAVAVPSTATASLGNLNAIAVGTRDVHGTAITSLGPLVASVIKAAEIVAERIRISGREPYRIVSGREPRDTA